MFTVSSFSPQGLQKGHGSHSAGPNGEPPFSSSSSSSPQTSFSSSGILNQVGHSSGPCTASSSASSLSPTSPQTTPNHLSSPPHCATTSGVHTKDAAPSAGNGGKPGAALPSGPEAAAAAAAAPGRAAGGADPAQGLTNHVQPRVTDGSAKPSGPSSPAPGAHTSDNPQLSALQKGKANASSNGEDGGDNHSNHDGSSSEKVNNVHPALRDAAKPLSERAAPSSPHSADSPAANSLSCLKSASSSSSSNSQEPTHNGKGPETSANSCGVGAQRRSIPAGLAPWSSVSIYPSSNEVLKACR